MQNKRDLEDDLFFGEALVYPRLYNALEQTPGLLQKGKLISP